MPDALKSYRAKRDFSITPEPAAGGEEGATLSFVIQKHWATRLHYDLRLELDGTMKSWAVPKGPSYDSHDKRMAVHVEDHPIAYNSFEGTIPEHQYGAGKVIIWDKGTWRPVGDARRAYADGNLKFELFGHKMRGKWALVRMHSPEEKKDLWLLIKEKDEYARTDFSVVEAMPDSVKALPPPDAPGHEGAAALPDTLAPQLATPVDGPPSSPDDWLYELKFDGYRILSRIEGKRIGLFTRNGKDWTDKLRPLRAALAKLGLPSGWYDGEIVVNDKQGRSDFGALQRAFDGEASGPIDYFLFDAPFFDGADLRAVPLEERRRRLRVALERAPPSARVRFSEEIAAPPADILAAACKLGLEGVIGKRRGSLYVSRRSPDWIKLKCGQRQEFVIGGYTDPQGARVGFGSLLLGTYDADGALRYAGNVGSGFGQSSLRELKRRLMALATPHCPFASPAAIAGAPHWVRPQLVAEVGFAEWTEGGAIRQAVFHGLRADKKAAGVAREAAQHIEGGADRGSAPSGSGAKSPAALKVSNPGRLIDADSGATKMDLVRYYVAVGALMLAHLRGRPVSLVRAPSGVGGELFFQKHADTAKLPGVRQLYPALDPEHAPMLEVATAQGLLAAAQWNVVEFHTQNAYARAYERPNRMVFDLDPGKGVEWVTIREGAVLLRAFLDELGLPSFLKTSGGKGLHVVVPIKPFYDWDTVKAFSLAIVAHLAQSIPARFVMKSGAGNRVGKIFIDYLRNGRGATTVCAWSARVRPGLGISVPLAWDELADVGGGDQWNIRNVQARMERGNAPWSAYAKSARSVKPAMKRLGFRPDDDGDA